MDQRTEIDAAASSRDRPSSASPERSCTAAPPAKANADDAPPIFVIGSFRSGTSLLRALLNAHPRIYLLQEASFFAWTEWLPLWWSGDRCLERYVRTFNFAWTRLDPARIRAALPQPLGRRDLGRAWTELMRQKSAQQGKLRYGEKNPVNSAMLLSIFASYPDARVIDIVRDPRAVLLSQTAMPWSSPSLIAQCIGMWIRELSVWPYRRRLLTIRLEDLLERRREVMGQVLKFVGEEWDEAVLVPHDPPDDGMPFGWLRVGNRGPTPANWKKQLSPAWIRMIEHASGPLLRRRGYERAVLDAEPRWRDYVRALREDLPRLADSVRRTLPVLWRVAAGRLDAAQAQQQLLHLNPAAWEAHPDWTAPAPPPLPTSSPE